MKACSYIKFFSHFTNVTKLKIVETLMDQPLTVSEISEKTTEEQSKISHNLSSMLDCNIVTMQQDGKKRIYSLNKKTVQAIMKLVNTHMNNFCDECQTKK